VMSIGVHAGRGVHPVFVMGVLDGVTGRTFSLDPAAIVAL
jgi:hypothetical protein